MLRRLHAGTVEVSAGALVLHDVNAQTADHARGRLGCQIRGIRLDHNAQTAKAAARELRHSTYVWTNEQAAVLRRSFGGARPGSNHASTDEQATAAAAADLAKTVLAPLSDRDRELLHLRFINGYDATEIASQLGTTAANVRVMIHRALDRARRTFHHHASTSLPRI